MQDPTDILTIGALAKAAGVNVETIRFYQRRGLLAVPHKPAGGIRRYGQTDVTRVRFIKAAQRLGFRLEQVAELLLLEDGTHCSEAADLAASNLANVRARLQDLQRMETALSALIAECRIPRSVVSCPLVAALRSSKSPIRPSRAKQTSARTPSVDDHTRPD